MRAGHLFMVGFMGAGKTTVACLVADALRMPCIDLDSEIEARDGRSVATIFEEEGEEGFRSVERTALLSLMDRTPLVVACGGGVVLRPENRAALKEMGTVVHLQVTAAEALARIGDASTRPLLAGPSGTLAATSLLQAREGLYRSVADIEIDTAGRTAEEVAQLVLDRLEALS